MTSTATSTGTFSTSLENLRSLLIIRSIALLGQIGVLCYVLLSSRTTEDLWGMVLSLAALGLYTMATFWRCSRPWPVSDSEFLAQLLIDVLAWTVLMYFTGGANNPFVSYYIVPLVVSAAVLPWRYTWLVALCSLAAYSLLLYVYRPFPLFTPHAHMGHGSNNVHILGMWFNFLFSAGLITYFVVRMAGQLRAQEARAVAQREQRLRNDQIMAVAGLAAGTAHELGTPLSTMTVLLDEMRADPELSDQGRSDCDLLEGQLQQCRAILTGLTRTAELRSDQTGPPLALDSYVTNVVRQWAVRRPGVPYEIHCDTLGHAPLVASDPTLAQALENLLNNGADAGSERIAVHYGWDSQWARIRVRDWGSGFSPEQLEDVGKPIIRASRSGLGIGLLLSHAAVERHGGSIELHNAEGGGAIATLSLPVVEPAHDE